MDDTREVTGDAETAHEAIRSISHQTVSRRGVPAPVVYSVLDDLEPAGGYGLSQALRQLGQGLGESHAQQGRGATADVAAAITALAEAAELAQHVGQRLEVAQDAIAKQGFKPERPAQAGTRLTGGAVDGRAA